MWKRLRDWLYPTEAEHARIAARVAALAEPDRRHLLERVVARVGAPRWTPAPASASQRVPTLPESAAWVLDRWEHRDDATGARIAAALVAPDRAGMIRIGSERSYDVHVLVSPDGAVHERDPTGSERCADSLSAYLLVRAHMARDVDLAELERDAPERDAGR